MLGKTIGKYRVVERIGRGGMGTVYKAVDETLDREVAVKVLNPDLAESDVVRRFRAEAMTLARLNHPGIATIYELFRTNDDLLMVMEFVRGETFDRIVERHGPLPAPRAASLAAQVLDALGHAHRVGIVHRDLKPANLMLTEYGSVKIMDFGIARVLGTEHLTSDGLMMGTPAYMAPEQVLATDVDARADLYSVGVVLYRLLTGNLPFKADTAIAMAHKQLKDPPTPLRQFRAELPEWCEDLLARALAKSPADRFQTAEEFRDALVGHGASLVPVVTSAAPLEMTLPPDRTPALSGRLESLASISESSVGAPSGSVASGEAIKEAEYAATIPVPTPLGIELRRSGATPAAKSGGVSRPTTDQAPAVAQSGPSEEAARESNGLPTSRPAESTTVILQKRHLAVAAGLFLLLIVVIGALAFLLMPRRVPPTASATTAAGSEATAEPPGQASLPAASTLPTASPPGATAPGKGSTSPQLSPPSTALSPKDGAPATPRSPERSARSGRDAALPPLTIVDIRVVSADGDRVREREAMMTFAAGVLTLAERDGTVVRSVPYEQIMSVNYSRSRQPMWQSPGGPAPVMRVGGGAFGMFRSDPHWVSIRTKEAFLVLRVESQHIRTLPNAFSQRAGVTVDIVRDRAR